MDITHLIAFGIGMVAASLKDLIQVWIIKHSMKSLSSDSMDRQIDDFMKSVDGYAEKFDPKKEVDKDSTGIERNYRSYYS